MDRTPPPPWLPRAAFTVALVILGVLAALWVADRLRTLIFMVFIALFISVALEPATQYLVKRGWKRSRATPLVFAVAFVVVTGFLAALIPVFANQAEALADNLPRYLDNIESWVNEQGWLEVELLDPELRGDIAGFERLFQRYGTQVAGGLLAVGNTVLGAVLQLVVIALFAYYMVAEGPKLRRTVLSFMPPRRQREVLRIWEIAVEKTGGYIYSRLVLAVVAAVYTALILVLLGIPYPVALGLWVGVLSQFIPVVGTYIAAVLPLIVAFFHDPISALWVAIALIAYQQVENFLVAPRITARAMAIHPAVSIGSVIAGSSLIGGVGAILALPVAATIQAFVSTAMSRHDVVETTEGAPAGSDAEPTPVDRPETRPED